MVQVAHSQEFFGYLNWPATPDWQLAEKPLVQSDCEPLFRSGSSGSTKSDTAERHSYTPVNFISDEARAFLLAYADAAKRRADAFVVDITACQDSMHSRTTDTCEAERVLAPPKRFFRTFWLSITLRKIRLEQEKRIAMLSRAHAVE